MGIIKNKVSRRITLGLIAVGLASTVAVLGVLKGRHTITMPHGPTAKAVDGRIVMGYGGEKIAIKVPPMETKTPKDKKTLQSVIAEQLKKDPKYANVNKLKFEEWKKQNIAPALAQIDELERQGIKQLSESELPVAQKRDLIKELKEGMQANRTRLLEGVAKIDNSIK